MEDKIIPLESILTTSASDYCASRGIDIRDYELRGIHMDDSAKYNAKMIEAFRQIVPKEAEAVVDFRYSVGGAGGSWGVMIAGWGFMSQTGLFNQYASGTALIPKKKTFLS